MEEESLISKLICSDEATFHLLGHVICHKVHIWELENPHVAVEIHLGFTKNQFILAMFHRKVYGLFFFIETTAIRMSFSVAVWSD